MEREAREREEAAKRRTEEEIKNEQERLERVRMERSLFDDFYKSVWWERMNRRVVKREGHEKFKEKLKRQRQRGQSGIGENFRVWRSEEDMILRQQYQCNVSLNKHRNLP